MKDLKILNGKIPCFDTERWQTADLLIHQGIITRIGTIEEDTKETIDAGGRIVAPGFIDIHAHEDAFTGGKWDFFTARCGLRMGVTTAAVGNCGENYNDLDLFCGRVLKEGSPVNYMTFVGQNTLRKLVGASDRYQPATRLQMDKMKKLLSQSRRCHPVGLSCGFEYAPGVTLEETAELLDALEDEGYLTSVHFRADGPESLASIEELAALYQRTRYAVQMSHIGSCCATGYMEPALAKLREARKHGMDIMADCYPYTAFCTGIGTAVFDPESFEKWDYSDLMITDGPYKNQRCTKELFTKLRKETPDMHVIAFVMNEEEIRLAYQEPYIMVGSDCGYVREGGHPRGAGTFPKVLRHFAGEKGCISLIDALRKMTVLPAERLGLKTKGSVKEGFDADLVIFDKAAIADRATFEEPTLPPDGINYVLIGGRTAVKDNRILCDTLGEYVPYRNL